MSFNLTYLLLEQASHNPHSIALIDSSGASSQRVTFEQLDTRSAQATALLRDAGLSAGDRILLFHPMAAELYIALGAIFRLGMTALFVDPSAGIEHLERCCRMAEPKALLATPKAHLLRLKSAELRRIPVKFATGFGVPGAIRWSRSRKLSPDQEIAECSEDTPALTTFTSGSTGLPKMAVRSHEFLRQQHRALDAAFGLGSGDIVLSTLPVFVLSHVVSGATTLIPDVDIRHPDQIQAGPLVHQAQAEQVTCIEGSPALFERIERYCAVEDVTLPAVQQTFTGGAPVFPDLLQRLQAVMPNATVTAVYGSTEAEPIAHIDLDEIRDDDSRLMTEGAGLLAGLVVKSAQVRIIPNQHGEKIGPYTETEFAAHCLPRTQPGEIVVSGPHVLQGYWQGQGDAETKFRVGKTVWHRTGDAGYFDAHSRLWLLGRCMARIADDRGIVYPFAIECAAQQHPEVKHAAFVAHDGRRLLALQLYTDDSNRRPSSELATSLRDELSWAFVDEVRVLESLPVDKRHNSKVDYGALQKILE